MINIKRKTDTIQLKYPILNIFQFKFNLHFVHDKIQENYPFLYF